MRSSGSFEDRFAIQDLYSTYADCSSRGDREVWLSLWADDAWWKTHLFERDGKAAITEQWDSIHDDLMTIAFLSQWGPIAVEGDHAKARSYAREIVRMADGSVFKVVGTYDDELVRRGGEWLFLRRDYTPMIFEVPGGSDEGHPYAPTE
jgi:ketosteroid isomerase-like protein